MAEITCPDCGSDDIRAEITCTLTFSLDEEGLPDAIVEDEADLVSFLRKQDLRDRISLYVCQGCGNEWSRPVIKKNISIQVWGDTDGDIELAVEEAFRKIKEDYTSGMDENSTGGYRISVEEE